MKNKPTNLIPLFMAVRKKKHVNYPVDLVQCNEQIFTGWVMRVPFNRRWSFLHRTVLSMGIKSFFVQFNMNETREKEKGRERMKRMNVQWQLRSWCLYALWIYLRVWIQCKWCCIYQAERKQTKKNCMCTWCNFIHGWNMCTHYFEWCVRSIQLTNWLKYIIHQMKRSSFVSTFCVFIIPSSSSWLLLFSL